MPAADHQSSPPVSTTGPTKTNQGSSVTEAGSTTTATASVTTNGGSSNTNNNNVPGPPEVELTIQRLSEHRNVRGVIILNKEGVVIRSSGPVFQGNDGLIVLRRYASEARKIDQLRFLRIELNNTNYLSLLILNSLSCYSRSYQ
ncbi:hypothetical protein PSTT_11247 [Puccinia striiformis]|uniref:Roadblock/LAMTOR2 domain-containing protein n=1 Tax=Puccinia striiformis TaxID=27350 RepID=A0A2S4V0W7_9BASI|nr:hypothetical protein PSTT_11247 [Puccinia striiformis]